MLEQSRERSKSATPPRPSLPDHYVKEETPPVMTTSKRGSMGEPLPPRPPPPFLYTSTLPPPAPKKYRSKSNDFKSKTLPVRKLSSAKEEEKPFQIVIPLQVQKSEAEGARRENNKEGDECLEISTPKLIVTDKKYVEKNNILSHSDPATLNSGSEAIFLTSFRKVSKTAPKNSLEEIGEIDIRNGSAGPRIAVVAANGIRNCIDDEKKYPENDWEIYHNKEEEKTRQVEKSKDVSLPFIKSCSPGRKSSSPDSIDDNVNTTLKNSDFKNQRNVSNSVANLCPEQMKNKKYPVARESLVSRAKHESQEQLRKFKKNVCLDDCKTKCSTSNTKHPVHDDKSSSRSQTRTSGTSFNGSQSYQSAGISAVRNNRKSPVHAIKSIMRKPESEKKRKKKNQDKGEKVVRESPIVLEDKYSRVLIAGRQQHSPTPSQASTDTSDTSSLAPSNLSLLSDLLTDKDYHEWLCSGLRESKNNFKELQVLDRYVLDMIGLSQDIKTPRASLIARDKKSSKEFDELIRILSYKKRHSTNFEMKKSLQIIIDFIGEKKENFISTTKPNSLNENSIQRATSIKFIEPRLEEAGDCFLDCRLEEQQAKVLLEEEKVSVKFSEAPEIMVCSSEKENLPVPSPRLKRLTRGETKSPTPSTASNTRVSITNFNTLIQDLAEHSAVVQERVSGTSIPLKDQSFQEVWLRSIREKMESLLVERDSQRGLIENLKLKNSRLEKNYKQWDSCKELKKVSEHKTNKKLEEVEEKLKTKINETEKLEKQLKSEREKIMEENLRLDNQVKVTQKVSLQLEKHKEELKENQSAVKSLNELVIKLNYDLDRKKTEAIEKESQLRNLQAENKKLQYLEKEFDKMRVEENSIFKDNRILKEKVEELEEDKNKIKMKESRLFEEKELMKKEINDIQAAHAKRVRQLEAKLAEEQIDSTEANKAKKMFDDKLREVEIDKEKDKMISKLKGDIKKRGILLRDAQNLVIKLQNEDSKKSIIKKMKNQIEDLESDNLSLARSKKNAEIDLEEIKLQLDEVSKNKTRSDEKYTIAMKDNANLAWQVEEGQEELQDILKKYKKSVASISADQITIQEQSSLIIDLELKNEKLKEKNLDLQSRIDTLETNCMDLNQHRKSQVKISDLEQKIEMELMNKMRLENQVERLKETAKKTEREHELETLKYQADTEKHRKLKNLFRDLKEDYLSLQGKESDTTDKNSYLNKKIEILESENIILKKDLELALKRIDDFHTAITSEIDSDSDTISVSDEEFLETLSQSGHSNIRDSITQEISDLSTKKV